MSDGPTAGRSQKRSRWGRWWRRLASTAVVLAFLFGLVVFVLPTPLARFVVDRQLTSLGIKHEGEETVVVDLWNSRVAVGPMFLGSGEAAPARIGSAEFRYSFANVFEGRALIEIFTISGVDIHVRRLVDGTLEINGIQPPATAPAEPPSGDDDTDAGIPFAFGMETLAFRDSRLVFEDLTGGTLTLDLALFSLEDFLSWEPEAPETIELRGRLNGMPFAFSGTSTLFADPITIDIEGGLEEATLDKVAAFTGPIGLQHQAGVLATHGRHRYKLADGAIAGTSAGSVNVRQVDLVTPEGHTMQAGRLEIAYDLEPAIAADRTVTIAGRLEAGLENLALSTPADETIAIAEAALGLDEIAVTKKAQLRRPAAGATATAPATGDTAQGLLQLLAQQLIALGHEVLSHDLEGSVRPTLRLEDVAIGASGQAIRTAELELEAAGLTARGVADTWSLDTPLTLRLAELAVDGPQTLQVGSLDLSVGALTAETDLDDARVNFDLHLEAADAHATSAADGVDARLASLALTSDAAALEGGQGRGQASGIFTIRAGDLEATLRGGDDATARIGLGSAVLTLSPLQVEDTGGLFVSAGGSINANDIAAEVEGADALAAKFASVAVVLSEATLTPSGQRLAADVTVSEATAETRSEPPQKLAIARTDIGGLVLDPATATVIERLTIGGLDGEVAIAAMGDGDTAAASGSEPSGANASALPPLRLGAVVVEPGSRLSFVDRSAGETIRLRLDVQRSEAGPIDTTAPETPTAFDVAFSVEDTATLTAAGSATPFAPALDGEVAVRVEGFPLPLVSPYASNLGGVTIDSGELSLAIDGNASAGALDGLVGLTVADLFLGEPSEEMAARFEENFGVPIGFAVGILKDGNGVIDFDLPVSGTITEPSIDFSEVVQQAIGGALASLFPTNWLDSGGSVDIEPVPFEPGSAELSEAGAAVADQVASILGQKSTLRVRVCGKGSRQDLAAVRGLDPTADEPMSEATEEEVDRVLDLALERGRAARGYLVERHGIAEDRIGDCRTSYSFEDGTLPRAEFQL